MGNDRFWHGDFNPYDDDYSARGRDPYYRALGYGDRPREQRGRPARTYSGGEERYGGRSYGGYGTTGDYGYGARGEYGASQFGGGRSRSRPGRWDQPEEREYWNRYLAPESFGGAVPGGNFVSREAQVGRVTTTIRTARPALRRGPRNYRRSDERIQEDICEQIVARDDLDASQVEIETKDGNVTLTGEVPERRMRYAIEDIAAESFGVRDVDNRIRVRRPET